jgi:RNA polymerase sigma factor (sigma-70 family)
MTGCYQTAEDLSQEAYLKVAVAIKNQSVEFPQPFLFQTAKNLTLDYLRKEKVRRRHLHEQVDESEILQVAASTPTPEALALIAEELEHLLNTLAGHSQRRREILILHKVQGWHYEKIAEHFGISKSAVEKNVRIALAHCLAEKLSTPD